MTRRTYLILGAAFVVFLTLAVGAIHGRIAHRWGPTDNMRAAARKLEQFPAQFGPSERWKSQSSDKMEEGVVRMLQCAGYVNRKYTGPGGREATLALILGPPGPISVHTPEICYSSRDFKIVKQREHVSIKDSTGEEHQFWATTMQCNDVSRRMLRVYYAWSTGGPWTAPKEPRFTLAGNPHLYKLQVAVHVPRGRFERADDAGSEFLEDLVDAARPHLVGAARE